MAASYTRDEISGHSSDENAWIINNGQVFDITEFITRHPGGREVFGGKLGKDVTSLMTDDTVHNHSKAAYSLLKKYRIGKLHSENDVEDNNEEELNMDGYKENELVDWSKPMVMQVGKLGAEYMKWVHSPVDRPLRLFGPPVVEFFSKTPWYIVPMLWLPIVLYLALVGLINLPQDVSSRRFLAGTFLTRTYGVLLVFIGLFMYGMFLWSFIEYILHRYLFHIIPPDDSPFWITFHFFFHGQHHKVPFDSGRLVFPPVAASAFAIPLYILFVKILPYSVANSLFSGGLLGYVLYDCIHYYLHHGSPSSGSYFYNLRSYHVAHHFKNPHKAYGISSKLWDFPFNTTPDEKKSD